MTFSFATEYHKENRIHYERMCRSMSDKNRVKKGALKLNELYFLRDTKGIYQFEKTELNPKTKKVEHVLRNMETGKPVVIQPSDLIAGHVMYGFAVGAVNTYKGEPAQYQGYERKKHWFAKGDGKRFSLTYSQMIDPNNEDFVLGYSKNTKTKRVKVGKDKREHDVKDFGKPISHAFKNMQRYRAMPTEKLKEMPMTEKLTAGQKQVLYDKPDFDENEDPLATALKMLIWKEIPNSPSVIKGVNAQALIDDYFEFVRTVWGEMTEPKKEYKEFVAEDWVESMKDNLFIEDDGEAIPPFTFFHAKAITDLAQYMYPHEEALRQYMRDKGIELAKDEKWKRHFTVLPQVDQADTHSFTESNGLGVLIVREPKETKRYTIDPALMELGMPENGDWIVVDRRKVCTRGKEGTVPHGVVTMKATSEEDAWKQAEEYYIENRNQRKVKKKRLVIDLTNMTRKPAAGVPMRKGNITEKRFQSTFAGWGGVFGATQDDEIRHLYLNSIFDGLQDMYIALGLTDTKDMGFHGKLSFGIGSHGTGGYEALFKPDLNSLICLTKNKGHGHLARMWFQALDYIIGINEGYGSSLTSMYSTNPSRLHETEYELIDYLFKGEQNQVGIGSNYLMHMQSINSYYTGKYTTASNMFARAGATYLLDKFNEKYMRNDFVNGKTLFVTPQGYSLTPQGEEKDHLYVLFDNLFQHIKQENLFKSGR